MHISKANVRFEEQRLFEAAARRNGYETTVSRFCTRTEPAVRPNVKPDGVIDIRCTN